mmetsp:Transcript_12336/g.28579  ORF Transcript_12336/g.28579 Transcript_12336/m.28579 type:complete len:259 (-) Transcript_12336:711-1487(-)
MIYWIFQSTRTTGKSDHWYANIMWNERGIRPKFHSSSMLSKNKRRNKQSWNHSKSKTPCLQIKAVSLGVFIGIAPPLCNTEVAGVCPTRASLRLCSHLSCMLKRKCLCRLMKPTRQSNTGSLFGNGDLVRNHDGIKYDERPSFRWKVHRFGSSRNLPLVPFGAIFQQGKPSGVVFLEKQRLGVGLDKVCNGDPLVLPWYRHIAALLVVALYDIEYALRFDFPIREFHRIPTVEINGLRIRIVVYPPSNLQISIVRRKG